MLKLVAAIAFCVFGVGLGKAQWTLKESHTTADLRGIDNVGGGVAWASGTSGTVLRTEDAGNLWQPCAVPPGAQHLDFRGIQGFDANTAIVMSSDGSRWCACRAANNPAPPAPRIRTPVRNRANSITP